MTLRHIPNLYKRKQDDERIDAILPVTYLE